VKNRTLELIWQGAVRPTETAMTASFKGLINALLPVHSVILEADHGIDGIAVMTDDMELMPALSLGDVLVEELGVEVPYGSFAFICDQAVLGDCVDATSVSRAVGTAIGQALLTVMRQGAFSLERENEALYVMASAYDHLARSAAFEELGLVHTAFSAGLACTVGSYWVGSARSARENHPFRQPGCLGQASARNYLTLVDPGFSAPEYAQIPSSLLSFRQGAARLEDWLQSISEAVSGALKPRQKCIISS
jgi:hypothetical protein